MLSFQAGIYDFGAHPVRAIHYILKDQPTENVYFHKTRNAKHQRTGTNIVFEVKTYVRTDTKFVSEMNNNIRTDTNIILLICICLRTDTKNVFILKTDVRTNTQ